MAEREQGTICRWDSTSGFGLIQRDAEETEPLRFNWRVLRVVERRTLAVGDRVEYETFQRDTHGTLEAMDMRRVQAEG